MDTNYYHRASRATAAESCQRKPPTAVAAAVPQQVESGRGWLSKEFNQKSKLQKKETEKKNAQNTNYYYLSVHKPVARKTTNRLQRMGKGDQPD